MAQRTSVRLSSRAARTACTPASQTMTRSVLAQTAEARCPTWSPSVDAQQEPHGTLAADHGTLCASSQRASRFELQTAAGTPSRRDLARLRELPRSSEKKYRAEKAKGAERMLGTLFQLKKEGVLFSLSQKHSHSCASISVTWTIKLYARGIGAVSAVIP